MNVIFHAHHKKIVSAQMQEKLSEKFKKLTGFFSPIEKLLLDFNKSTSHKLKQEYIVRGHLHVKGKILHAYAENQSLSSACDLLYSRLSRQLKKYKNKRKSHRVHASPEPAYLAHPASQDPFVVRENDKHYKVKPMAVEDAIEELNANSFPFLVFRNMHQDEQLSVIYPNGNHQRYNIIAP